MKKAIIIASGLLAVLAATAWVVSSPSWDSTASFFGALLAFILVLVKMYGRDIDSTQFLSKERYEIARDTLSQFYEARNVIRAIRCPMSLGGEVSRKSEDSPQNPPGPMDIFFTRMNRHHEFFVTFQKQRYKFAAVFGEEHAFPFDKMALAVNEMMVAAHVLSILLKQDFPSFAAPDGEQDRMALIWKHEGMIYENKLDPDPLNSRVDLIVKDMESFCDMILQKNKH